MAPQSITRRTMWRCPGERETLPRTEPVRASVRPCTIHTVPASSTHTTATTTSTFSSNLSPVQCHQSREASGNQHSECSGDKVDHWTLA
jgi:hypothetical protein